MIQTQVKRRIMDQHTPANMRYSTYENMGSHDCLSYSVRPFVNYIGELPSHTWTQPIKHTTKATKQRGRPHMFPYDIGIQLY